MYYLNIFYINSILGYISESIFSFIFKGKGNSGILFGPWTPVYGIGSIFIVLIYKLINKHLNLKKFIKLIIFFFSIAFILSIIEIMGGYLIESIFHEVFWNYEKHIFNIGKYTSLEMAIIWGIAALIYILLFKKFIDKIEKYIPKSITYIITVLFSIDLIATTLLRHN